MAVINTADKIYVGSSLVSAVYSGTNLVWPSVTVSYDTSTTAWINAVVAAGGSVSTPRKAVVDALIVGLKTDGIWAKLDRLWVLAAENNQSARIDLVALDVASTTTSPVAPTFTTDRGYAGNGSNAWLDTTFNPTTQGTNYVLNSAHISIWDNTIRAAATTVQTGTNDGSAQADMFIYTDVFSASSGFGFRVNDAGAGKVTNATSQGFFIGQRIDSNTQRAYFNGAFRGGYSQASSQLNAQGSTFFIGARCDGPSGSGSGVMANTDQISIASYGGSLTHTEATNFYNRLHAYMYALGIADETDPQVWAWKSTVLATGGTISTGRMTLIRNLIAGLKTDGVWAKLDRLFVFAAENNQAALIDLVGLAQGNEQNGPVFIVDQGYWQNGTSRLGLNYNPANDAVHFTSYDGHIGVWNLENASQSNPLVTDVPSSVLMIYPRYGDGNTYTRVNDQGGGIAVSSPLGWVVGDRSSGSSRDTYKNGSLLGNVAVGAYPSVQNLPTVLFVGGPCAAMSIGSSLTSTNHTALYNRLRTYMTAVGVP